VEFYAKAAPGGLTGFRALGCFLYGLCLVTSPTIDQGKWAQLFIIHNGVSPARFAGMLKRNANEFDQLTLSACDAFSQRFNALSENREPLADYNEQLLVDLRISNSIIMSLTRRCFG
jgi:hypothetical protein